MLTRIEQRADHDCVIAVVATVMGSPYGYERVQSDQHRYAKISADGLHLAWWEKYLWDEGFPNEYHPLVNLSQFVRGGRVVGILNLAPATGQIGHVVAVDEYGFINPSMRWPDRISSLAELLDDCRRLGATYVPDRDFLAVWKNQ